MSYLFLDKARVVQCDVDDTLILWEPEKYKHEESEIIWIEDNGARSFPFLPHKRHIDFLRKLKLQGYGIIIWSAAGAEWADTVVKALGIGDIPDIVQGKPELCIDDLLESKKFIKSIVWIDPDTGDFKRNA